jgi:hypothetical protein
MSSRKSRAAPGVVFEVFDREARERFVFRGCRCLVVRERVFFERGWVFLRKSQFYPKEAGCL